MKFELRGSPEVNTFAGGTGPKGRCGLGVCGYAKINLVSRNEL